MSTKDTGESTIEPAHEALLRQWGLLQGWLAEDAGLLAVLEGVKRASRDWARQQPDAAWLTHATERLAAAERLRRGPTSPPTWSRRIASTSPHAERPRPPQEADGGCVQALIYVLMLCVIGGLLARMYERELRGQWFWATTFRGQSLTEAALGDLKPGDAFAECVDTLSDDQKTHRIHRYCPDMVVVRSGKFMMGDEGTNQHEVVIAEPFAVSTFAVTFDQWDACVAGGGCDNYRPDDARWGRGTQPVIYVSWHDAQRYVDWLNRMVGKKAYRLLSEAEFEYAARAGSTGKFPWGDDIGKNNANCSGCGSEWDAKQTAPSLFQSKQLRPFRHARQCMAMD